MSSTTPQTAQYDKANEVKAAFDDHYNAQTPHKYLAKMRSLGYQIAEQARSYCTAAAKLVADNSHAWPVQMLDVGCSYGIGSAFVRHGCTFEELVSFFESRAPRERSECVAATRTWLNVVAPAIDMRVVGLDASENAIRFGLDTGLLDGGIARDLEVGELRPSERAWVRGCNMLVCTGAIGYVGAATFAQLIRELGKDHPNKFGPVAVLTILRMFDPAELAAVFEEMGWRFVPVDGVRLPQRAFADAKERRDVIAQLHERGIDTDCWESRGVLYADLYAAAPAGVHAQLVDGLSAVASRGNEPIFRSQVEVATARRPVGGSDPSTGLLPIRP